MQSRYVRVHGTRQQQLDRLRAKGWQTVTFKAAPVVAAFKASGDRDGVMVKAWRGDADKPAFYSHYFNMAGAESAVALYFQHTQHACAEKAEQIASAKAKREAFRASDHWTEGDVFSNMWGYDQTNIDWYQIVAVKAKSVLIRPIAKNYRQTGHMSGDSQPRRNDFTGPARVKQLDSGGRISMAHGCATKWDGKACHETHYA